MGTGGAKAQPALGFLTVVEHETIGLCGGYLLLNLAGRPLEFHCTSPIKPNRAQQILYGPTLTPYLYGEQIGQSLVAKSRLNPWVVYTDLPPVMALRQFTKTPTALVIRPKNEPDPAEGSGTSWRVDAAHSSTITGPHFQVGRNTIAVASSHPNDQNEILSRLNSELEALDLDLIEPFERIREAIEEARGSSK